MDNDRFWLLSIFLYTYYKKWTTQCAVHYHLSPIIY